MFMPSCAAGQVLEQTAICHTQLRYEKLNQCLFNVWRTALNVSPCFSRHPDGNQDLALRFKD